MIMVTYIFLAWHPFLFGFLGKILARFEKGELYGEIFGVCDGSMGRWVEGGVDGRWVVGGTGYKMVWWDGVGMRMMDRGWEGEGFLYNTYRVGNPPNSRY
ncbi:hypothetical protein VC83_05300 [Pseudogymnoascus destructans]|uniref:Uncharacterized protein n=1 Tax=Pseudogymnoascus destructans TaxID=655981 RepID=A0A177A8F7_9PEZI|nr:uncharacterized protein VC83_05300 [Pseudogymnoascus destructans]OAF58000.1 hypothetical protein VC83_05300 [Pseudogymnoascus destructans]